MNPSDVSYLVTKYAGVIEIILSETEFTQLLVRVVGLPRHHWRRDLLLR